MKKISYILCLIILSACNLHANIIYVNINAAGAQTGTSWTDAYTQLTTAVTAGGFNDTIWVTAGTYYPTTIADRGARFNLHCSIYGGFSGNETLLSQRNWKLNPTIISGDIGVAGNPLDNTVVLFLSASGSNATIDGLIITDAYNNISSLDGGAAILIASGFTKISNCIIKNNYGLKGCGISMPGLGVTLVHVKNTIFLNNTSPYDKGLIDILSATCRIVVTGCVFNNNNGTGGTCLTTLDPGDIKFYNNTFVNNVTTSSSGGSIFRQSPNTNTNNLLRFVNNIYWNNTGAAFAGISNFSNTDIDYSLINPGAVFPFQATFVIAADPLFNDYDGTDNIVGNSDDDLSLTQISPAINTGNADTTGYNLLPYDLNGTNRVVHDTVDIGAYEYGFLTGLAPAEAQMKSITAYPNPVDQLVQVTINKSNSLYVEYKLSDINGHIVEHGKVYRNDQSKSFTINTRHLSNGAYLLSLWDLNDELFTKLIIHH